MASYFYGFFANQVYAIQYEAKPFKVVNRLKVGPVVGKVEPDLTTLGEMAKAKTSPVAKEAPCAVAIGKVLKLVDAHNVTPLEAREGVLEELIKKGYTDPKGVVRANIVSMLEEKAKYLGEEKRKHYLAWFVKNRDTVYPPTALDTWEKTPECLAIQFVPRVC